MTRRTVFMTLLTLVGLVALVGFMQPRQTIQDSSAKMDAKPVEGVEIASSLTELTQALPDDSPVCIRALDQLSSSLAEPAMETDNDVATLEFEDAIIGVVCSREAQSAAAEMKGMAFALAVNEFQNAATCSQAAGNLVNALTKTLTDIDDVRYLRFQEALVDGYCTDSVKNDVAMVKGGLFALTVAKLQGRNATLRISRTFSK